MNLVHYCLHKHYPTFAKDEDLVSVGMIGLCKAAKYYDPERGKFSSLACRCILNEIKDELRSRMCELKALSLEHEVIDENGEPHELVERIVGDEDEGYIDIDGWISKLKPRTQEVVKLRLQGLTQAEIADELGVKRQVINTEVRRARLMWEKQNS